MKQKNNFYVSLLIVSVLAIAAFVYSNGHQASRTSAPVVGRQIFETSSESRLLEAFQRRESNIQVQVAAPVVKVLSDDNDGSRHQRFLIALPAGPTILISHNIDLAPRVEGLSAGDTVTVEGEYEWNEKGGVIHWTHHDPRGTHPGGWIERDGRRYQ